MTCMIGGTISRRALHSADQSSKGSGQKSRSVLDGDSLRFSPLIASHSRFTGA